MPEHGSRTERSCCPMCTSMCGILVDLEVDKVVGVALERPRVVTADDTACGPGASL